MIHATPCRYVAHWDVVYGIATDSLEECRGDADLSIQNFPRLDTTFDLELDDMTQSSDSEYASPTMTRELGSQPTGDVGDGQTSSGSSEGQGNDSVSSLELNASIVFAGLLVYCARCRI